MGSGFVSTWFRGPDPEQVAATDPQVGELKNCEREITRFPDWLSRSLSGDPALLGFSAHLLWGLAVGTDGEAIARALHQRETQLPVKEDQTSGQRRVDALASICLDSITGTGEEAAEGGRAVTVAEVCER